MEKILVTGGNGFLGANLTRALHQQGYAVRVMVRPGADLCGIAGIPCEIFNGQITRPEQVMHAVEGCDYVVHAAAITDQWDIPFHAYESINFTGTKNIVAACMAHQVRRLIFVSTANTMGPGSKDVPGSELNGFTLFHANSGYINTKYLAQQYVLEQVERAQLPAIVVNPTFMLGPYDNKPSSGKLLLYGLRKKVLLYPPGGKNFVHIQDVCQGIINAMRHGQIGNCYLLAGENLSYEEFFTLMDVVNGSSRTMIRVPPCVMKAAGILGSLKEKLTRRSSKVNYTTAYLSCLDNYYTGKKSERELKLTYTPIATAIRDAITWFKYHNYYPQDERDRKRAIV